MTYEKKKMGRTIDAKVEKAMLKCLKITP